MNEHLKDTVHRVLNKLDADSIDGRAKWVTAHTAKNKDHTVTVVFRAKHIGKSYQLTVDTQLEAKQCCDYMHSVTRR